jgi:hypothetical protein
MSVGIISHILLFFYKKKNKKTIKYYQSLQLVVGGTVVRNECMDHFSIYIYTRISRLSAAHSTSSATKIDACLPEINHI